MDWVFAILLFLHVIGAIIAFGPGFSFPLYGAMARREPQHANYTIRLQDMLAERVIIPLALFQGVTGLGLLWKTNFVFLQRGWLLLALVLYVTALALNLFVLRPIVKQLIAGTSGPPPTPHPNQPPPSGPPPHIATNLRRARMLGLTNVVLITVIVFLMVTKPF